MNILRNLFLGITAITLTIMSCEAMSDENIQNHKYKIKFDYISKDYKIDHSQYDFTNSNMTPDEIKDLENIKEKQKKIREFVKNKIKKIVAKLENRLPSEIKYVDNQQPSYNVSNYATNVNTHTNVGLNYFEIFFVSALTEEELKEYIDGWMDVNVLAMTELVEQKD